MLNLFGPEYLQFFQDLKATITQGWTQGALARNKNNESVSPLCDEAICWSLPGAFLRLHGTDFILERMSCKFSIFCLQLDNLSILERWNDIPGRTQRHILAFINECICEANNITVRMYPWTMPLLHVID